MSQTNCSRIEALLPLAAAERLSDEKLREVERHLAGCDACARALAFHRQTDALLSQAERLEPPADLADRVLAAAGRTASPLSRRARPFSHGLAAGLAVGVAVGALGFWLTGRGTAPAPAPPVVSVPDRLPLAGEVKAAHLASAEGLLTDLAYLPDDASAETARTVARQAALTGLDQATPRLLERVPSGDDRFRQYLQALSGLLSDLPAGRRADLRRRALALLGEVRQLRARYAAGAPGDDRLVRGEALTVGAPAYLRAKRAFLGGQYAVAAERFQKLAEGGTGYGELPRLWLVESYRRLGRFEQAREAAGMLRSSRLRTRLLDRVRVSARSFSSASASSHVTYRMRTLAPDGLSRVKALAERVEARYPGVILQVTVKGGAIGVRIDRARQRSHQSTELDRWIAAIDQALGG